MNLIKTLITNFIYGGLILGILLTIIDIIQNSKSSIGFYAFLAGSFFIINLFQYKHINNLNKDHTNQFLYHSIIGGIVWVILSILLYYINKILINDTLIITSMILINIFITIIYYYYFL